ncbi:hypothetical protein I203_101574 [Kwoniella mangroviensis CBS 8507]|uniref:uncharacterized protein n=1 Tax=Kwoniella mangroviensis CBS 8507 TaxID=1296122 RepID=UPI0030439D5E
MSYPTRSRERPSRQSYMPQHNPYQQQQPISIPTIPNLNSNLFHTNNSNNTRNHQRTSPVILLLSAFSPCICILSDM